jgi:amylosucrase
VQRILMGHALIAGFGGIPLIYMGDELAVLNDYSYAKTPEHAHDSRWLHRPRMDWEVAGARHQADTPAARVFQGLRHILARRRYTEGLHSAHPTEVLVNPAAGVFSVARRAPTGVILCLYNFGDNWAHLPEAWLWAQGVTEMHDALSDAAVGTDGGVLALPPQARVWLM